eukprot:12426898-Karenia_brevis.AAC.1
MQPRPSDVLGVDGVGNNSNSGAGANEGGQEQQGNQEYGPFWWGDDVGAINNANIQCWLCGGFGHMGKNYP